MKKDIKRGGRVIASCRLFQDGSHAVDYHHHTSRFYRTAAAGGRIRCTDVDMAGDRFFSGRCGPVVHNGMWFVRYMR